MKKEPWYGWNRQFNIDMRAEKEGIIATSVEETFEYWKTTVRSRSPKWDHTYFGMLWWTSVTDCLDRGSGVWALYSFFLSSWGAFIHLEGGHHNIELIRKQKYSRNSYVSVLTDKGLFWDHYFYHVVGKERSRWLLMLKSFRGLFRAAEYLHICGTEWDTSGGTEGVRWNDGETNLRKFM